MHNKRLLFLFFTIVLYSVLTAFADAAIEIEVGSATYETKSTEQTIDIPITLSGNTAEGGILALGIDIEYDEKLTLTKVTKGDGLSGLDCTLGKDFGVNPYRIMWDGLDAVKSNGVIATLTFSVPAGSMKDYCVNVTVFEIYDNDMNDIYCTSIIGELAVKGVPDIGIAVGSAVGVGGDRVEIPVVLSGNTGVGGISCLGIEVSYDDGLMLSNVTRGDALSGLERAYTGDIEANPYKIIFVGDEGDNSNGEFVRLTFTLPKGVTHDYNINVNVTDLYDCYMNDLPSTVSSGVIEVNQPEVCIDVESVVCEGGDSVVVPITLSGNTSDSGILALGIDIEYDEELTLNKAINGDGLSGLDCTLGKDFDSNPYRIIWDGLDASQSNGTLAMLTFTVPSGAADDYAINVTVIEIYDDGMVDIPYKVTNGKVSVSASGTVSGTNLKWTFANSKLTITGSGDIPNYTSDSPAPWSAYADTAEVLEISDGVTAIGNRAFVSFAKLTAVKIPEAVTKIGSYAFASCTALTEVTFGSNIKTVGSNSFNSCSALDKVHISSFDDWCKISFASVRSNPANLAGKFYIDGIHCTEVKLTKGVVTSIGAYAFRSTDITMMYIPSTVKSIGNVALSYCDELTVTCHDGSYAQTYCEENGIPYELLGCDHEYGDWTETEKATCTLDGAKERSCTYCGETETGVISATGHSYMSVVCPPQCTETGYTEYTCDRCGDSYRDNYTKETGHSFGEWITKKEPTAIEEGEKIRECANCDATESEVIPKIDVGSAVFSLSGAEARPGDTVKLVLSVKATDVANSIALSNIKYDEEVLEFVGFGDYDDMEEMAAFSPVFDAERGYFLIALSEAVVLDCEICTLEFKVKNTATDAVVTVSADPIVKFDSLQIPSELEEGKIEVFTYLKGDIDGDEDVDVDDAIYLFGMTMLPQFYPDNYPGNTDFNKDGAVDLQDAILLFNYSMLPDIYPIG